MVLGAGRGLAVLDRRGTKDFRRTGRARESHIGGSERGEHSQTCTPTVGRPVQGHRSKAQLEDKGQQARPQSQAEQQTNIGDAHAVIATDQAREEGGWCEPGRVASTWRGELPLGRKKHRL